MSWTFTRKGLQELLANVFITTNVERCLCPVSMAIVKNVRKMSGNHFDIQNTENRNPSVLDLWPSDATMNRGHLLVMAYHLVSYENLMINSFQNIIGYHLDIQCHLELWPNNPKIRQCCHLLFMIHDQSTYEICRLCDRWFSRQWAETIWSTAISRTLYILFLEGRHNKRNKTWPFLIKRKKKKYK